MRNQLLRLKNSTKAERIIGEILKNNRIKFKVRERIGKFECDFVIGKLIIEIDGSIHQQTNQEKDIYLFSNGYVSIHISAYDRDIETIEKEIVYLIKTNNYGRRND